MLVASQLAAMRGERTLFSGIDFALAPGEILEVTGANGSGKTTLLRVLCGLLTPSAGSVQWQTQDIRALREDYYRDVAYIGHLNGIKDDLSPLENLRFAHELRGERAPGDAQAALTALGLTKQQQRLSSKVLSQGQKRRVALARALFGGAKLWILDEPFAALDATALSFVAARIAAHAQAGGLAVLSSHQDVSYGDAKRKTLRLGSA